MVAKAPSTGTKVSSPNPDSWVGAQALVLDPLKPSLRIWYSCPAPGARPRFAKDEPKSPASDLKLGTLALGLGSKSLGLSPLRLGLEVVHGTRSPVSRPESIGVVCGTLAPMLASIKAKPQFWPMMDLGSKVGDLGMGAGVRGLASINLGTSTEDLGQGAKVSNPTALDLGPSAEDRGLALMDSRMGTNVQSPTSMDPGPGIRDRSHAWDPDPASMDPGLGARNLTLLPSTRE